jgi:hypothetical protein
MIWIERRLPLRRSINHQHDLLAKLVLVLVLELGLVLVLVIMQHGLKAKLLLLLVPKLS